MKTTQQKRILAPTDGPLTWKKFLADPEKHWQPGYSAMSTAFSWEKGNGLPAEISKLFKTADEVMLRDASVALVIPEYKVKLAGGSRPSQNDVFALMTCSNSLISVMVEGKAKEDFDKPLGEWKKKTSTTGGAKRLADITKNLGLQKPIPDEIRYQLLHRTASSVIEAKRFHAAYAVMIVQSFNANDSENHYDDFCRFVQLFERAPAKNTLIEISQPCGKRLFVAWVQSKPT